MKKIVRADVDKQLAEIITDPKRLEDLLKLKNTKRGSTLSKQIISRLFGYYVLDEKFFEDDQYTPTMIDFVDSQKITQAVDEAEGKEPPQQTASLPLDLNRTSTNPADIPQAPVDTGLASIQMKQNYDTLFPQDELGSAISKRGMA